MSSDNTGPNSQQAFEVLAGVLVSQIFSGGQDCWPAINGAVRAIVSAANRSITFAWEIVDQREATIRGLTTQLDNCVNGSNFRQREFESCTRELAAVQADQATCTREIGQIRSQYEFAIQQIQKIPLLISQRDTFWKAEKRRQEAPLEEQIKQLTTRIAGITSELTTVLEELTRWRNGFPGLGPLNASKQFHDALATERTELVELESTRRALATALLTIETLRRELSACQESCNSNVLVIQRNCQNTINQYRIAVVRLQQQITILEREYRNCSNNYAAIVIQYNNCNRLYTQCKTQVTKCPPVKECTQCTTISGRPGVCSGICREVKANG